MRGMAHEPRADSPSHADVTLYAERGQTRGTAREAEPAPHRTQT
jgi:hypothetical protein